MNLYLDPELVEAAAERADRQGTTLEEVVRLGLVFYTAGMLKEGTRPDKIDLMDRRQVAERLNIPMPRVKKMIDHGEIEAVQIGDEYRVHPAALERYIREHTRPVTVTSEV